MYKTISIILALIISSYSHAQELADTLLVCAENTDSQQRLACYDNLAKQTKAKRQASALATVSATTQQPTEQPIASVETKNLDTVVKRVAVPPPPKKTQQIPKTKASLAQVKDQETAAQPEKQVAKPAIEQSVSAEDKFGYEHKRQANDLIQTLNIGVTKVSKTPFGKMIITLDNGQVWRQTDKVRLKIESGQTVSIERGMLGSFFMGTDEVTKRIRVKRVK